MLKIYTINDGTAYAIRLTGPKWTWTAETVRIAQKAINKTFKTETEAENWIDSQKK